MQAIEFSATVENGIIQIPDLYINKIPSQVKVLITENTSADGKKINFDELILNTRGFKYNRDEANDW